jgi:hypothetical protein
MPGPRWPWLGLTALYAFMGVDEISSIHERIARLTGLRWEIPYIPIMLGAAVLGVAVLLRLYRERPRWRSASRWQARRGPARRCSRSSSGRTARRSRPTTC